MKAFAAQKLAKLLGRAGKDFWKVVKPDFSTGASSINTVLRYGPDIAYPVFAASTLPEGATAGDRAGAFVEDLGINLLSSGVGQYGGRKLGNRLAAKYNNPALAEGLQTGGDLAAGVAQMVAPRPLYTGALQKSGLEQQQLVEAQIRAEEREKLEAAVAALIAGGGLAVGLGNMPASAALARRTVM